MYRRININTIAISRDNLSLSIPAHNISFCIAGEMIGDVDLMCSETEVHIKNINPTFDEKTIEVMVKKLLKLSNPNVQTNKNTR